MTNITPALESSVVVADSAGVPTQKLVVRGNAPKSRIARSAGFAECARLYRTRDSDVNKGREGVAGSQLMSTAVHRRPNKLWRSDSIFNLCL